MTGSASPDSSLDFHPEALSRGRLAFQRCEQCGHAWLPPSPECPACLSPRWHPEDSSGAARVISWVVYHRAVDPSLAGLVPYNVALVELAEGPRMITNVVGLPHPGALEFDMPVALKVETGAEGRRLARFQPPGATQ